jgi:hypothetical protein
MTKVIIEKHKSSPSVARRYSINQDGCAVEDAISEEDKDNHSQYALLESLQHVFIATFLPVGYPDSVREEYLTYQFWDSLQGLSSYVRGVLTAQSVLAGAGVGSAEASAISAAIVWAIRDGIGMISSLTLAYHYSDAFEVYFKEWRLVADILNNLGLTLSLLTSIFPSQYIVLTSCSTICQACCGLIAGSTKSRISAHFARGGHLADITAKESTQETAVALVGLCLGILCTKYISHDVTMTWILFLGLLALHTYANYRLVKVLVVDVLNPQRCYLLVRHVMNMSSNKTVEMPSPEVIASSEALWRPIFLSLYGPKLGESFAKIAEALKHISSISMTDYLNIWDGKSYMIGYDVHGGLIICLDEGAQEEDQLQAYLIAMFYFLIENHQQHPSRRNLEQKYHHLLSTMVETISWCKKRCDRSLFTSYGWDLGNNKTRLSINSYRLKIAKSS